MPEKGHTQYGGKTSIKNRSHEAVPTAESCSLVSHLLMDDLIIGTFTHPYTSDNTSNNTLLYVKPGCAEKKRGAQWVKKSHSV